MLNRPLGVIPDPATQSRVVSGGAGIVIPIESVFRRMVHVNLAMVRSQDDGDTTRIIGTIMPAIVVVTVRGSSVGS